MRFGEAAKSNIVLASAALGLWAFGACAAELPTGEEFTNSLGMEFVRIEAGRFTMGEQSVPLPHALTDMLSHPTRETMVEQFPGGDPDQFVLTLDHVRNGDFDERPVHEVVISKSFFMGAHEVTNAEFERFAPSHRALRGKMGFSNEDDEAVVYVDWNDAAAFCAWLSEKEGRTYRLPTEAEWEYACRAGTTSAFWTGDSLPTVFHRNARRTSFEEAEDRVPLTVGKTPPNPWGLYDMHGNVEEWCLDWYGPYAGWTETDPIGRAASDFKVTRGGSHGTNLYFLRSANRMATLPENKHWLIGFRVALGDTPSTTPLPPPPKPRNQLNVVQESRPRTHGLDSDKPYFKGPRQYVKIKVGAHGPLFAHHNHDTAITNCPNGDLLAVWYTCVEERGRELAVAASRLRYGEEEWEPASTFWDVPDRDDHCPALWYDGQDTIYHFNGLSVAGKWEPLAIVMRTSRDSGATWSKARLIVPEHGYRQMVSEPVFRTASGALVFGADAGSGSTVWVSRDSGATWSDPGGHIRGIHAGIAELSDGRLFALGRGENVDGWMPASVSSDMGKTWTAGPSVLPPITSGQRPTLLRLREGPLFFASFTANLNDPKPVPDDQRPPRHISSIFGAVSFDEGKTWPVRRIITDGGPDHAGKTLDDGPIRMSADSSEPQGYLSACQDADGVIHLISSINHYAFNLAWLKEGTTEPPKGPQPKSLPSRELLAQCYDAQRRLPHEASPPWWFSGDEQAVQRAVMGGAGGGILVDEEFPGQWSNERTSGWPALDARTGFTVEAQVDINNGAPDGTGFILEAFARGGALTSNHYLLTVTPDAVRYWYDGAFVTLAEGLRNGFVSHAYRMAVRADTAVQIYRDAELLGTMPTDLIIDWKQPARGSYISWGVGKGAAAAVRQVSYESQGAFAPQNPAM